MQKFLDDTLGTAKYIDSNLRAEKFLEDVSKLFISFCENKLENDLGFEFEQTFQTFTSTISYDCEEFGDAFKDFVREIVTIYFKEPSIPLSVKENKRKIINEILKYYGYDFEETVRDKDYDEIILEILASKQ